MKRLQVTFFLFLFCTVVYSQENNTGTTPFEFRRHSSGTESLKIGIGDRSGLLEYVQDYDEGTGTHDLSFNISSSISHFYSWKSNGSELFRINSNGNVGIGTTDPQSKLAVEGQIRATEVKVLADISVPDYVFEPDYKLRTLRETKEYITENKHLPEIPSAAEIGENGIDLGDMNMRLLKKIEELTLYQIELLEKLEELQNKVEKLENK